MNHQNHQLYKVTGPSGEAIHGGNYVFHPGVWTPEESGNTVGRRGLYHLTTDPTQHLAIGCRAWEAEHAGVVATRGDKVAARSCRITVERPDMIPHWWRDVEAFVASIRDIPWLDPQGEPDHDWRMFESADAARAAARDAAMWEDARGASWEAAREAAGSASREAAVEAAGDAAWYATRRVTMRLPSEGGTKDAAFMAECIAVGDLLGAEHIETAREAWDVWRRGYALYGRIDGQLWVYRV